MPTSEIVKCLVLANADGKGGLRTAAILAAELDARVPAEHKYQERWPSDYKVTD